MGQENTHQTIQEGALVIDVQGLTLSPLEIDILQDARVSGLILFSRNYQSVDQIEALVAHIRSIRSQLIIYVDQEGGRVQRFKEGLTRLPALKAIAAAGSEALKDLSWVMAKEILSLGIDVSFTPVLDVDYGNNDIIGDRAFGQTAQSVIDAASHYLEGMERAGMAATGKHFPGHGYVSKDSHLCLPVDQRSFQEIEASDIEVFRQLHPRLGAMMTAHILYDQCDQSLASYSTFWIEYLRQTLGFKGVVFSDDLVMQGARIDGGIIKQAQAAQAAGCDLLLVCNDQKACLELLEHETLWSTQASLSGLRGRLGQGYKALLDDPEYQDIQKKHHSLLKSSV